MKLSGRIKHGQGGEVCNPSLKVRRAPRAPLEDAAYPLPRNTLQPPPRKDTKYTRKG